MCVVLRWLYLLDEGFLFGCKEDCKRVERGWRRNMVSDADVVVRCLTSIQLTLQQLQQQ